MFLLQQGKIFCRCFFEKPDSTFSSFLAASLLNSTEISFFTPFFIQWDAEERAGAAVRRMVILLVIDLYPVDFLVEASDFREILVNIRPPVVYKKRLRYLGVSIPF